MRKIEILDDVRLRFPARDAEFDLGLEIGAITVLLAQGLPIIDRMLSTAAVEQLRPIAEYFRYMLVAVEVGNGMMSVSVSRRSRRPELRLVSSRSVETA